MPSNTMQQYKLYKQGSTDGLCLETVEKPRLRSSTEVLIKVHAISLNARDNQIVNGTYGAPVREGVVVVSDGAGEIVEVGSDVDLFKVGDRVTAMPMPGHNAGEYPEPRLYTKALGSGTDGMASEYFRASQEDVIHMPSHMTYEEAATLPIACGTAWSALYGRTKQVTSGDVVVCMGTGGVSFFTAALALGAGARVIMTSSSDEKADRIRQYLSHLIKFEDAFQVINRKKHSKVETEVERLTGGNKADFIIEIGGVKTLPSSIRCMKPGGLIALTGMLTNIASLLLWGGPIARGIGPAPRNEMKRMHRALEASQFRPLVDKVFDFDQLKEAYEYSLGSNFLGKIVIRVAKD
ncbi:alcohol dehydrogenase [Filobasidium floriforme]|uniref:alcohol dehydrogenase n=1 Tax=Filobasidium floriforme TaxID=5210 RepID=UPI001E8EC01D|nr:alcohol dehydrogenase [Filobasidium floriforme]KAH8083478.1 alcohol dehydrogenase [Filobasidium floriforme]